MTTFRSTTDKIRTYASRYALGCSIFGAALLGYIKTEFVFRNPWTAGSLVTLDGIVLFFALVLGVNGLPKLESFIALFVFTVTGIVYCFTWPHYMVI